MTAAGGGLRIVVAGAGLMGRWHVHAARRHGAAVAAIVDPDRDRAEELARRGGGAAILDSMDALSSLGGVDVVHVCAPLSGHAELARRALESGAHALIEKPLARSAKETGAILEAAAAAGLLVCPVHQFAFQRSIERVAARLPALGAPRRIAFDIRSAGGEGRDPDALDEIVADILPHPLSVLRRLWPEEPLESGSWQAVRAGPGEVAVTGLFGGATLSIALSMGARPTCCSLSVHGSRGSAEVDLFHDFAVFEPGTVSRARKIARPFLRSGKALSAAAANLAGRALRREPAYPGLGALIGAFYASVRANAPAPISSDDTLAVAAARDGVIQKAFPHLQEFLLSA